jgi:choline dehydrogenase
LLHLLGPNNNVGIQAALQHPWSRGTIFITSNSAFTNPAINPDYFSVGYDIDIMNNAMRFARRIGQANPMSDLTVAETTPGATVTGDALDDYIRTNGVTTYHPIGTCSMLPRDMGGVVDTRLIVYGTGNIRVVDSSIIPLHMSAHTMGTTYGVAEKAAEIIKRKYYAVQEVASTSEGESATGSATSAKTTGTGGAVAGASNFGANAGMSTAAKIGVGAGVGAGVLALLAALVCPPSYYSNLVPQSCTNDRLHSAASGERREPLPKQQDGIKEAKNTIKYPKKVKPVNTQWQTSHPHKQCTLNMVELDPFLRWPLPI